MIVFRSLRTHDNDDGGKIPMRPWKIALALAAAVAMLSLAPMNTDDDQVDTGVTDAQATVSQTAQADATEVPLTGTDVAVKQGYTAVTDTGQAYMQETTKPGDAAAADNDMRRRHNQWGTTANTNDEVGGEQQKVLMHNKPDNANTASLRNDVKTGDEAATRFTERVDEAPQDYGAAANVHRDYGDVAAFTWDGKGFVWTDDWNAEHANIDRRVAMADMNSTAGAAGYGLGNMGTASGL